MRTVVSNIGGAFVKNWWQRTISNYSQVSMRNKKAEKQLNTKHLLKDTLKAYFG